MLYGMTGNFGRVFDFGNNFDKLGIDCQIKNSPKLMNMHAPKDSDCLIGIYIPMESHLIKVCNTDI